MIYFPTFLSPPPKASFYPALRRLSALRKQTTHLHTCGIMVVPRNRFYTVLAGVSCIMLLAGLVHMMDYDTAFQISRIMQYVGPQQPLSRRYLSSSSSSSSSLCFPLSLPALPGWA